MKLVVIALIALSAFGADAPKVKASREELLLLELSNYKATVRKLTLEVEGLKKQIEAKQAEEAERELLQKSLVELRKKSSCKDNETFSLTDGVITCRAAEAPNGK